VVEAAAIRLRPVLMTSLCTAFGAVPLMIATGAGAESRHSIGAAVFFGTIFSLALTLFVVPALYALFARNTRSPHYVSDLIERLLARGAGAGSGTDGAPAAAPASGRSLPGESS
jgi:multidrug efflux pump